MKLYAICHLEDPSKEGLLLQFETRRRPTFWFDTPLKLDLLFNGVVRVFPGEDPPSCLTFWVDPPDRFTGPSFSMSYYNKEHLYRLIPIEHVYAEDEETIDFIKQECLKQLMKPLNV